MNTNQYTQKTLEALQAAQQLAVEYQHNALEPEHLLHALASQEQGLIPQLLQKLNVDPGSFAAAVAEKLSALPRVSGSGRDPDKVYISQATDKVLSAAAREAKAMKDEYVSVEHVFLGLLDEPTQNTTELFRAFNIKKDAFLQQLTAVRGNQRVTNDNPEDTYNALQKYVCISSSFSGRNVGNNQVAFAGSQSNNHARNIVNSRQFGYFRNLVDLVIPNGVQLRGSNRTFQVSNALSLSLRRILFNKSYYGCIVVGFSKVYGLFTLGGDGHTSDSSVNFAAYYCRSQTVPFNFMDFQLSAHGLSHFLCHDYVITISIFTGTSNFNSAAISGGLGPVIGSVGTFHTNLQNLFAGISFFIITAAASSQCHCSHHSCTQKNFK